MSFIASPEKDQGWAMGWQNHGPTLKSRKLSRFLAKPLVSATLRKTLFICALFREWASAVHFADVFSKLLGCFCCADEACNHDSHYPQELFLPVSHVGKAAWGNLHCLCRQSLPGAVNMATFPSGIFTKYVEEISLKIMGLIIHSLLKLTPSGGFQFWHLLILYVFLLVVCNTLNFTH